MNNNLKWAIIILFGVGLIFSFVSSMRDPLDASQWKTKKICTRQGALFNITEKEYGCPLEQCELVQDYKTLAFVDKCLCPDTNTTVFRYCESYDEDIQYQGDVDQLRSYILKKNPELKSEVHWEIN